jgi:hypothetical protein
MCAIRDPAKLQRLKELLHKMMAPAAGDLAIVDVSIVRGLIHHERRLHQLLLQEEEAAWSRWGASVATDVLVCWTASSC